MWVKIDNFQETGLQDAVVADAMKEIWDMKQQNPARRRVLCLFSEIGWVGLFILNFIKKPV